MSILRLSEIWSQNCNSKNFRDLNPCDIPHFVLAQVAGAPKWMAEKLFLIKNSNFRLFLFILVRGWDQSGHNYEPIIRFRANNNRPQTECQMKGAYFFFRSTKFYAYHKGLRFPRNNRLWLAQNTIIKRLTMSFSWGWLCWFSRWGDEFLDEPSWLVGGGPIIGFRSTYRSSWGVY